jgi:hypothetical protein
MAHRGGGADDQQAAEIPVALLRYPAKARLAAGGLLLGCLPEPGGELPARRELRRIGDGRCDRSGGDDTNAGDSRQTLARLVSGMPGLQLAIECADLVCEFLKPTDQDLERRACIGWSPSGSAKAWSPSLARLAMPGLATSPNS